MSSFKSNNSKNSFKTQITELKGFQFLKSKNSEFLKVNADVNIHTLKSLLQILRNHKIAFSFYDPMYISLSDDGAYISYSQEQNRIDSAWNMTLGNHGWSGGIYTINEENIIIQLFNLIEKKLLELIEIDNVVFFSHYDKVNIDSNINQNALIYGIHSNVQNIQPNYLIFGLFISDNYSPYYVYKLTESELSVDDRCTWNSERHSNGYAFKGEKLSNHNHFELLDGLLNDIPLSFLTEEWPGFYSVGNKDEYILLLSFSNSNYTKTISIDKYEIEIDNFSSEEKRFYKKIIEIIEKLNQNN